jgi:hypothetical protein
VDDGSVLLARSQAAVSLLAAHRLLKWGFSVYLRAFAELLKLAEERVVGDLGQGAP